MTARVAVIDDQPRMAEVMAMVLQREGYDVTTFTSSEAAIGAFETTLFDCVLTDLKMPGKSGLDVLAACRDAQPDTPVILVTAYATVETALNALKSGAFDYLEKPVDNHRCRQVVRLALAHSQLKRENRDLRRAMQDESPVGQLIAQSPLMQQTMDLVRRAALSSSTVLIGGQSGSGKEVIARSIHYYSDRVDGPFVAVNCKAFAEGVLESELFGHEKGAFTGAERRSAGIFERASGGSLFLDEIGETDGDFQAKLLRVIQEGELQRVGGQQAVAVDCRIICASNRKLEEEVRAGRFREDLYYRLNVIPIEVPALVERPEDILPLARQFLQRVNQQQGRCLQGFAPEVEAFLQAHSWPGNVRELENIVERGAVLARTEQVEMADLGLPGGASAAEAEAGTDNNLQSKLDQVARAHVARVLEQCGGSRRLAAAELGVERTTLYRMLKKYGL